MNYDCTNIPQGYDRGRDHGPEFLDLWMRTLEPHLEGVAVQRVLDLGCGTGRFSQALAEHFRSEVVGVDPSVKMLEQARKKNRLNNIRYAVGSAEAVPLASTSVDVIFMSMSFHHFVDRLQAASECRRVLRTGGVVCVRTGIRERSDSYPYVSFFPSTPSKIAAVLPDQEELCRPFEAVGFRQSASEVVMQTIAPSWSDYAEKLSAGGDSVLATLSPSELASGLDALRRYSAETPEQNVVEPIDLFIFR